MKIGQISFLYNTLDNLKNENFPLKVAYKMALIFDKIDCEYNFYAQEMRKIIEKYGQRDDRGEFVQEKGNIKINPDYFSLAQKALEELQELN